MSAHSHGEQQSLQTFWQAAPQADRQERAWSRGPSISSDDLRRGSGCVERVTASEWWAGARAAGDQRGGWQGGGAQGSGNQQTDRQNGARSHAQVSGEQQRCSGQATGKNPRLMGFGKYRDRLMADVREEESGYWRWALNEVNGFRERARKAGLMDGEEDAA